MSLDHRLLACAALSLGAHWVLARALDTLPPTPVPAVDHRIEITVVTPPPPEPVIPMPPPEPVAPPPDPTPVPPVPPPPTPDVPAPHPRVRPAAPAPSSGAANPAAAPSTSANAAEIPTAPGASNPVFGVSMESTSQGGTGPAMPVGNTTRPGAPAGQPAGGAAGGPGTPAAAFEVTRMPVPQGGCFGKYTEEARAAATEGVVVLDLTVGADGRSHDVNVVTGLPHGLTEAAITALQGCRFSPGEKSGQAVATRVRGFKVRFVLQDGT